MNDRYHTVVLRRHVWHRQLLLAIVVVLAAVVMGFGYYLGGAAVYSGVDVDLARCRELELVSQQLQEKETQLRGELVRQQTQQEVDKAALELVRGELVSVREEVRELQQALAFYRSFMAPEQINDGLSVRNLELVVAAAPRQYRFSLVVQQKAQRNNVLKGFLHLSVVGDMNGEPGSYDFGQLSEDITDEGIKLRFRYFQLVRGSLVLPPGFIPKTVKLLATASSPRNAKVVVSYPWQIKEEFSNVGH